MQQNTHKPRIKDIAKMAGVSEGTVDRVLHNRGEVSEKSKEAVLKVLEEIQYSPNLLARSLASKKHYRFSCLIPAYMPGDYWEFIENALIQAGNDFLQYNIHIDIHYFNQFDSKNFLSLTQNLLELRPDAVILAPIFRDETLEFAGELKKHQIPFSFIDSLIEEADFTTYYGQNSFQSGFVAAKLLLNDLPGNSEVLVIRTKRQGAISNQTKARFDGFMHYFTQYALHKKMNLVHAEISDSDDEANLSLIQSTFREHPGINSAITFNSKVYRLANYLQQLQFGSIRLIGYDLLNKNVEYLKKDIVSFLIAQSPGKQAYYTVRDLCNKLILKQDVNHLNFVPIDILMKENISDYINFREKY
jgi:LacI family transcriptional regulator